MVNNTFAYILYETMTVILWNNYASTTTVNRQIQRDR